MIKSVFQILDVVRPCEPKKCKTKIFRSCRDLRAGKKLNNDSNSGRSRYVDRFYVECCPNYLWECCRARAVVIPTFEIRKCKEKPPTIPWGAHWIYIDTSSLMWKVPNYQRPAPFRLTCKLLLFFNVWHATLAVALDIVHTDRRIVCKQASKHFKKQNAAHGGVTDKRLWKWTTDLFW